MESIIVDGYSRLGAAYTLSTGRPAENSYKQGTFDDKQYSWIRLPDMEHFHISSNKVRDERLCGRDVLASAGCSDSCWTDYALRQPPAEILVISQDLEQLAAARDAGMVPVLLARDMMQRSSVKPNYRVVQDLRDVLSS